MRRGKIVLPKDDVKHVLLVGGEDVVFLHCGTPLVSAPVQTDAG